MTLTEKIDRRIEECEGCAGKGYAEEHEHFGNAWGEHGLATFLCPLCESDRALKCAVEALEWYSHEGEPGNAWTDSRLYVRAQKALSEISRLLSEGE